MIVCLFYEIRNFFSSRGQIKIKSKSKSHNLKGLKTLEYFIESIGKRRLNSVTLFKLGS